jgi:multiple sugar transport system substrate-binding protein
VPYGVPSQTTPELLFYRKDWFARGGLAPPATTDDVIARREAFPRPAQGRYGVAWNAARGTALGHTFMMTCADFGQPIIDLPEMAGGYAADHWARRLRADAQHRRALAAAEYLMELLRLFAARHPVDVLVRARPPLCGRQGRDGLRLHAAGAVFRTGRTSAAPWQHRLPAASARPEGAPVAPVGGYALCIPANLPEERVADVVEALVAFTSPGAQKLYVQNGSRTAPRYSVGADPEVRRLSPIFERSTRCPGATSCSSGRGRRSRRSPTSSTCAARSCTTCCAAS